MASNSRRMRQRPLKKDKYVVEGFLPEVPEGEQTAAFKLFHKRYLCLLPQMFTETSRVAASRGVIGDERGGALVRRAQELHRVMLTPAAMVMLRREGAPIELVNRDDAKIIYADVRQHLLDWRNAIGITVNQYAVPTEDLAGFDMLAADLYPIARYDIERERSDVILAPIFNRNNFFERYDKAEAEERLKAARGGDIEPQHRPIFDSLGNPQFTDGIKSKWT